MCDNRFIKGVMDERTTDVPSLQYIFSQNFPLAIERDSAHAGSTIEDCILSYKSDFILHNSTLHVLFYDRSQSN